MLQLRRKFVSRQKPKKDGESALKQSTFTCCSILSDHSRELNKPHKKYGGVAQLGEHLPCKQGVMGSIPIISTNGERERDIPKTKWAHSSGG